MNRGRCFGAGGALLALIFSILCLTVSALTTLSSASRDSLLADKLASDVQDYYSADCRAIETAAALKESIKNGNTPDKVGENTIYTEENGQYSFSVPIREGLSLNVKLAENNGKLTILSWLQTRTEQWTPDESLKVWTDENDSSSP
ncbi:MAG: hypothetical protein QMB62_09480 [Oscillospiraceae bacterium]